MTPEQIGLVKSSWAKVVPIKDDAAALFYGKLFELDPTLKPLFKGDMKVQGDKLMAMIDVAVMGLDNLSALIPAVRALGERHSAYGVKSADYDTVAAALLSTLATGLGASFTPDVKAAWAATYGALAGVMTGAA
jgi:hemoglobin-like flavoprotein